MLTICTWLLQRLRPPSGHGPARQGGFSTAELLGNAALAIAALVVIWAGLQQMGVDVIAWIQGQLLGG